MKTLSRTPMVALGISQKTSARIANVGIVCAFLVVLIHVHIVCGNSFSKTGLWFDDFISRGICRVAVPMFFVISGFLLANRFDDANWYRAALKKRVGSLLLPMMFWSFMLWVVSEVLEPILTGTSFKGGDVFEILCVHPFKSPYHGNLWFVRSLLAAVVFSPLLKRYLSMSLIAPLFAGVFLVAVCAPRMPTNLAYTLSCGLVSLNALAWMGVDFLIRGKRIDESPVNWKVWAASLFVAIVLLISEKSLINDSVLKTCCGFVTIPFLMIALWGMVPMRRVPLWFVSTAFPVFVLHVFVLRGMGAMLIRVLGLTSGTHLYTFGECAVIGGSAFVVSVMLALCLRRISPKFSKFAFGGR